MRTIALTLSLKMKDATDDLVSDDGELSEDVEGAVHQGLPLPRHERQGSLPSR